MKMSGLFAPDGNLVKSG